MSKKVLLVTVSDDRGGRKQGEYGATQAKMRKIFTNNPEYGITDMAMWTIEDIMKTDFYSKNKTMLDNIKASMNGRCYKPYAILEGLRKLNTGDFLIYNDCSPNIWDVDENMRISKEKCDISVLKKLCEQNGGILSSFVKWDKVEIPHGQLGIHTHRNFTLNRCMNKMGMRHYEDYFMHASGMMVLQKCNRSMHFLEEWLYWNCDYECASMGNPAIPDDESFWVEESKFKMGCRHDQSISGLIINRIGNKLVDFPIIPRNLNPHNFLAYSLRKERYIFRDTKPS